MELPIYKSINVDINLQFYQLYNLLFMRPVQFDFPYVGAAKLLFGMDGGYDFQGRLSKPFGLLAPGLIAKYTGVSPWNMFILQNILFLFLFTTFLHRFSLLITSMFLFLLF
jgi:hypothetical protein